MILQAQTYLELLQNYIREGEEVLRGTNGAPYNTASIKAINIALERINTTYKRYCDFLPPLRIWVNRDNEAFLMLEFEDLVKRDK
jgi:hypothetical protein